MKTTKYPLLVGLICVLLGAAAAGCGDNPVGHDDDDDEHSEAHGLRVILNGMQVYRVLAGEVSCLEEPCEIAVEAGEETALITLEFLDQDGDEIHAEDLDEDFTLGFEIDDNTIAEFEQHPDDGKWSFRIVGVNAGETRMQLQLLHVGHADFTTPPLTDAKALTIRVTQG